MDWWRFVPLFRTRPAPAPSGWFDRMLRNRRRPHARVVLLGDVVMNLSDWWYGVYHRTPAARGTLIERDREGRLLSLIHI